MATFGSHDRLAEVIAAAARGQFPPADGTLELLPAPAGAAAAVLALTGRVLIASPLASDWFTDRLPAGDPAAAASPAFLAALGHALGREDDGVDVLLAAPGLPGTTTLQPVSPGPHPRLARAHAFRAAGTVAAYSDRTGAAMVILGQGLAGRTELAVEVDPPRRGDGVARAAITEARRLAGPEALLFAQVAPGNAASLRAFLAAGFRPIGSEVLFLAPLA